MTTDIGKTLTRELIEMQRYGAQERFWSKVDRTTPDKCWEWLRPVLPTGYARFGVATNVSLGAHRVAYSLLRGPIPPGLVLDHLCRNRRCCNPDHLEPVTQKENERRGLHGILTTHCKYGHAYTPENTFIRIRGRKKARICRECERIRNRLQKQRRKAESRSSP